MALLEPRVDRLEEVLATFMSESARVLAGIGEQVAEIRVSNARTDRRLLEMQQHADTDRQQAEKNWQQAQKNWQQAEKDRQQVEKDRQQAEKDRRDFNRRIAELTDQQGLLIENMVWPNLERVASELFVDEPVLDSGIRLKRKQPDGNGDNMEIDLLAASASRVLVCEAKSKIDAGKVDEFLGKLERFKEFFPEYSDRQLIPMMATIAFEPSVLKYLTRQGVYALGFGDETMELLNQREVKTS